MISMFLLFHFCFQIFFAVSSFLYLKVALDENWDTGERENRMSAIFFVRLIILDCFCTFHRWTLLVSLQHVGTLTRLEQKFPWTRRTAPIFWCFGQGCRSVFAWKPIWIARSSGNGTILFLVYYSLTKKQSLMRPKVRLLHFFKKYLFISSTYMRLASSCATYLNSVQSCGWLRNWRRDSSADILPSSGMDGGPLLSDFEASYM